MVEKRQVKKESYNGKSVPSRYNMDTGEQYMLDEKSLVQNFWRQINKEDFYEDTP